MSKCLCKVCGITDRDLFYSSIATYCKEHWKEKVRNNRTANADYYREYDRNRASRPERRENAKRVIGRWKLENPERRRANVLLGNALKSKKVEKLPCFCCGNEKTEAHHPDYSAPLDVVWLCPVCHKQTHAMVKKAA